jgi:hypothetical protein
MSKQAADAKPPTIVNSTVRKYLTSREVEKLMEHARKHSRDRNRGRRRLGRKRRRFTAGRYKHRHTTANQIGRERW